MIRKMLPKEEGLTLRILLGQLISVIHHAKFLQSLLRGSGEDIFVLPPIYRKSQGAEKLSQE